MSATRRKIICLMGPTAAGKTQLAIDLLQKLPLEIVSVDSAMVYRGMDIGTAKPTPAELAVAPHHLINIRDPKESYSAANFVGDAVAVIQQITARNRIPLLTGGTMLYFRALEQGLSELPSADPVVREKLLTEANRHGWAYLHTRLATIDPQAAKRIHPNDTQRIQRALEVYEISGQTISVGQAGGISLLTNYEILNVAVAPYDRQVLHERIKLRFEKMLVQGFMKEVEALFARGDLSLDAPAIRSVGYRQAWEYFLGHADIAEVKEKSIIATRQLAKRQLTWLRNWSTPIEVLDSESINLVEHTLAFLHARNII